MTTAGVKVRTSPEITERTPPTRHVYHAICNSNQNPRIAYCGHKGGPLFGVPYIPNLPDVCNVRIDMHQRPCTQCERW